MLQTAETCGAATHAAARNDDETLLTSNQTRARVGNVSHMCIWRWIRTSACSSPSQSKSTAGTSLTTELLRRAP